MQLNYKFLVRVGKCKPRTKGHITNYKYSDCISGADGWYDASKYLPREGDLCFVKTEDGKILKAWVFGVTWDGLNVIESTKIIAWKKTAES